MIEAEDVLVAVLAEVLEQQAFMFAEPCPRENLESAAERYLEAEIGFEGELKGRLGLVVPAGLGMELAANVLGLEAEEGRAMAQDALKELLNVVCGRMLTGLRGTQAVFDLSIPSGREAGRERWEALRRREGVIGLRIEEFPALVRWAIEEEK